MRRLEPSTLKRWIVLAAALLAASMAHAAAVDSVSPQGEVAQVRQVTVKFSEPVVPFGDLRLPDPVNLQCAGPAAAGAGRWIDDRSWQYDFRESLPPGVRCVVKVRAEWKPLSRR